MNLIIDIGNTRVKIAIISHSNLLFELSSDSFDIEQVGGFVTQYGVERAIVSSTRGDEEEVVNVLREVVEQVILFDHTTPIPIANSYSTPETLGRDRLAAAVGAWSISKADNQLVVDLGTAITIDLITQTGGFEGGVISPGMMMRFRALSHFTAALPLCSPTDERLEVARTTKEAIEQGVMQGITNEIEGHIERIRKKYDKIDVIFTGGDAKHFDKRIKNTIFAASELVVVGLNRILEYNAE